MKRYTVQANQFNLIQKLEEIEEKHHTVLEIFHAFEPVHVAFVFFILVAEPIIVTEQDTKLTDEHA